MPTPGPLEVIVILLILALVVLPVVVIFIVVRGLQSNRQTAAPDRDPAMDALRTRFARGEIDEVEFQRLSSALRGT